MEGTKLTPDALDWVRMEQEDAGDPNEAVLTYQDWWEAMDMRQEQERDDGDNLVLRACHSPESIVRELATGMLIREYCKAFVKCPPDTFHACERTIEMMEACREKRRCAALPSD